MTAWDMDPNHLMSPWRLIAGMFRRRRPRLPVGHHPALG